MNDNATRGDPRDEIDARAGAGRAEELRLDPPRQGEIKGPLNALKESALAVELEAVAFDSLIATAHRFPRNLDVVRDQLQQIVTYDEAAAENSVYALPRGDKPIVGPSIGFANALATAFGNCWDDGRWLYTDRREKIVVGGGVFIDWQTNRRTTMTEQRRISGKNGALFSEDMIVVTSKAASAVARRNAILAGVPRPLWFPVFERALYIVRGTEQTLPERRDKAITALANFGVKPDQVLMYLGIKAVKDIGVEHIPTLRGMFQQLRDGAVTVAEMFDPRRMVGMGFEQVQNPLGDDEDAATGAQSGDMRGAPEGPTPGAVAPSPGVDARAAATAPAEPVEQAPAARVGQDPPAQKNEPAPAAPAAATPSTAGKGSAPAKKVPASEDEYLEHACGPEGWITRAASRADLADRKKAERSVRLACALTTDGLKEFDEAFAAKVAALGG